MSMAASLGSRSSFSGASMMERKAQAETAMRARGSVGNKTCGVCEFATGSSFVVTGPSNSSVADSVPRKCRLFTEITSLGQKECPDCRAVGKRFIDETSYFFGSELPRGAAILRIARKIDV